MSQRHLPRWYRDATEARIPRVRWLVYQRLIQDGPRIIGEEDVLPAVAVLATDTRHLVDAYRSATEAEIAAAIEGAGGVVVLYQVWCGVACPMAPEQPRPPQMTWNARDKYQYQPTAIDRVFGRRA